MKGSRASDAVGCSRWDDEEEEKKTEGDAIFYGRGRDTSLQSHYQDCGRTTPAAVSDVVLERAIGTEEVSAGHDRHVLRLLALWKRANTF